MQPNPKAPTKMAAVTALLAQTQQELDQVMALAHQRGAEVESLKQQVKELEARLQAVPHADNPNVPEAVEKLDRALGADDANFGET